MKDVDDGVSRRRLRTPTNECDATIQESVGDLENISKLNSQKVALSCDVWRSRGQVEVSKVG